jgi:hypothetical protein|nr:MAG TPA: hypothetical protein [Caudoviricetes sp.]
MAKRLIKAVSNEHFDDIFQYIDKMDDNKIRDLLVLCSKYDNSIYDGELFDLTEDNFNKVFKNISPWVLMRSLDVSDDFLINDDYFVLDGKELVSYSEQQVVSWAKVEAEQLAKIVLEKFTESDLNKFGFDKIIK